MNKLFVIILISNCLLAATGVMLILISSFQYNNWWSFFTIFVHFVAIFCPLSCQGCNLEDDAFSSFDFDDNTNITQTSFGWFCLGVLIIVGYAIPIELYRTKVSALNGVYLTISGSTIMLISILVFIRTLYFKKDSSSAYLF